MAYFHGMRTFGPFLYEHENKVVRYQINEWWEYTGRARTTRCGVGSGTVSETIEIGVDETALETFRSSIEQSFGIGGIANLKGHIESNIQSTITLSRKVCKTETFEYPAPECGSQTISIHQHHRKYSFLTEWQNWLGIKRSRTQSFTERSEHFEVRIERDEDDPACPCREPDHPIKGEVLQFSIGCVLLRGDAIRVSPQSYAFSIGNEKYIASFKDDQRRMLTVDFNPVPTFLKLFLENEDVLFEGTLGVIAPDPDFVDPREFVYLPGVAYAKEDEGGATESDDGLATR